MNKLLIQYLINFSYNCYIQQGIQLLLTGSPFGILNPKVFLNSVTHGMLSNVVEGQLNETNLLMTDARVLAGYEVKYYK